MSAPPHGPTVASVASDVGEDVAAPSSRRPRHRLGRGPTALRCHRRSPPPPPPSAPNGTSAAQRRSAVVATGGGAAAKKGARASASNSRRRQQADGSRSNFRPEAASSRVDGADGARPRPRHDGRRGRRRGLRRGAPRSRAVGDPPGRRADGRADVRVPAWARPDEGGEDTRVRRSRRAARATGAPSAAVRYVAPTSYHRRWAERAGERPRSKPDSDVCDDHSRRPDRALAPPGGGRPHRRAVGHQRGGARGGGGGGDAADLGARPRDRTRPRDADAAARRRGSGARQRRAPSRGGAGDGAARAAARAAREGVGELELYAEEVLKKAADKKLVNVAPFESQPVDTDNPGAWAEWLDVLYIAPSDGADKRMREEGKSSIRARLRLQETSARKARSVPGASVVVPILILPASGASTSAATALWAHHAPTLDAIARDASLGALRTKEALEARRELARAELQRLAHVYVQAGGRRAWWRQHVRVARARTQAALRRRRGEDGRPRADGRRRPAAAAADGAQAGRRRQGRRGQGRQEGGEEDEEPRPGAAGRRLAAATADRQERVGGARAGLAPRLWG